MTRIQHPEHRRDEVRSLLEHDGDGCASWRVSRDDGRRHTAGASVESGVAETLWPDFDSDLIAISMRLLREPKGDRPGECVSIELEEGISQDIVRAVAETAGRM